MLAEELRTIHKNVHFKKKKKNTCVTCPIDKKILLIDSKVRFYWNSSKHDTVSPHWMRLK